MPPVRGAGVGALGTGATGNWPLNGNRNKDWLNTLDVRNRVKAVSNAFLGKSDIKTNVLRSGNAKAKDPSP
jgi:hypothetical protein